MSRVFNYSAQEGSINYFPILFPLKSWAAIGKFSHQWVNTEHKASLTLNSTILADSKAAVDREKN